MSNSNETFKEKFGPYYAKNISISESNATRAINEIVRILSKCTSNSSEAKFLLKAIDIDGFSRLNTD